MQRGFTTCVEDENRQDIVTYVRDKFEDGFLDEGNEKAHELGKKIFVQMASGAFQ